MPTQTNTMSTPKVGKMVYTHSDVVYLNGKWQCNPTPVTDPPVNASTWNVWSRVKARTWVHSSPWPVPVGQLKPVNPYEVTINEYSSPPVDYNKVLQNCYRRWDYTDLSPTDGACNAAPPATDEARKSWLNGRAMLAFLLKVKDQKSQLLVSLAEGRQTVNMVARAARDIAGLRKKWLRKQPKSTRGDERRLHSSWLEYRYGWMPLYYDAYGIAKHLSSLDSKIVFPVRASANWESDRQEKSFWNGFAWKGDFASRNVHRYKAMVGGFVIIESRVARESVRAGLTNPLELAWELLPYSFVVDWFIRVGDYVEGMTALSGVTLSNCFASFQADKAQSRWPLKTTYPTNLTILSHPPYAARRMEYNRWSVNPSLMHVGLTDLVDLELQKQSWKHWVDASALLKAAFRER